MVSNIYIGDYRNLTTDVITNLYLYGTTDTPTDYIDRLRTKDEYAALNDNSGRPFGKELTITLEMGTYMTVGAGRYAHASDASFVQKFFNNTRLPFALPDGEYTKQWFIDNYTVVFMAQGLDFDTATTKANAEFSISVKNYAIDANSADYSYRTYVFNNAGFTISSDAVFVVRNGIRYVENMAVHAFSDNFDFVTDTSSFWGQLAQLGNQAVLKNSIDPYNIGRTVAIKFTNKQNVPVDQEYNINDFIVDKALSDGIPKNGYLATTALPAMISVVNYLKSEGAIEYTTPDGGVVRYGTTNSDSMLSGTSHSDTIIGGEGSDTLTGGTGDDAFLVIDKNGDGKINDITEMFGNADISGFAQLKSYDSNGDGVINSADSQFNLLRLWNDKNANGKVDAGEITTLEANDNAVNDNLAIEKQLIYVIS